MRRGRRLIAALVWAVLTALAILYWRRGISASSSNDNDQDHHSHMASTILTKKIWQVTGDNKIHPARHCTQPWITSNPGWSHAIHTDTTAAAFAARYWDAEEGQEGEEREWEQGKEQRLATALGELKSTGIRADLIRYMLLGVEGGVYTDMDTVPLRGIDSWLPWDEYLDRGARLMVGLEWDGGAEGPRGGDGEGEGDGHELEHAHARPRGVLYELQFCQWTIVAVSPGHPVFRAMIRRALDMLARHREFWGVGSLGQVVFSEEEVLNITGPAAWTEVLLAHMQGVDPDGVPGGLAGLSGLTGPRLVGDVLVLPVDAFASGMDHSGSTREGDGVPEAALVRHLFRGSWREGKKGVSLC